MAGGKRDISRSVEDYLVTVYKLVEGCGRARTTAIAKELGVKPATVTKVMSRLASKGLVRWVRYRGYELTEHGRALAERVIWRHRVVEAWLHSFLGYSGLEAHRLAHYMEHLPDELVVRIYERIGRPSLCPHGNPIPGAPLDGIATKASPLKDFKPGTVVKLVRIAGEVLGVLEFAERNGLEIGLDLCIESRSSSSVRVRPRHLNKVVEVPHPYSIMLRGVEVGRCGG